MKLTPAVIAEYAHEVEQGDPIDWGMLSINEHTSYLMVAGSVLELYESMPAEDRDLMLIATVTKLVVENMVLNLKLQSN